MKKFFYDKRIVFMYLITIVFLVIGTTYALSSNSMALGLTTAIVRVDEEAYGSTTFDTSELEFIPILDSEVETNQENVIHIDFKVGGDVENNNDNIIYDIALNDLNVNCDLLSPYIKWKLVKNGEEISNGSLDYKFDTIDENGRLVLTSIQQDLVDYSDDKSVYDDYNFYMWFSDSCQGDLLSCMNSGLVDQSNLLGQNLSGKIEVELYTESKKELVRKPETTLTNSKCDGKYFATLETDGGVTESNTIAVVNGQPFGQLPTPTRTDVITFDTNGGGDIVFVNKNLEEKDKVSLDKKYFDYFKEEIIVPRVKRLADDTNTKSITYTFEGWYLDQAFTKPVTSATRVDTSKNIKLYAKWSGDNQIALPESNRPGYDFLGWYHDITLNNKAGNAGDSYIVDGSKTLFAKWDANLYTIKFHNNLNYLSGANSVIVTLNGRNYYKKYYDPALVGYLYNGTYTGPVLVGTTANSVAYYTDHDSATTFTSGGTFEQDGVTYYYASDQGYWMAGDVTDTSGLANRVKYSNMAVAEAARQILLDQDVTVEQEMYYGLASNLTANSYNKTGYTFNGWSTSPTGSKVYNNSQSLNSETVYDNNILNLYANWNVNSYNVTYNSGNLLYGLHDIGSTNPGRVTYSISNGLVTVKANYDDGYFFTNGRVNLEAGVQYIFSATTSGVWGGNNSNSVEGWLMKDGTYSSDIPYIYMDINSMNTNGSYTFTPTVSGNYWLRLDVNTNGVTHTFSNISISRVVSTTQVEYGNVYPTFPTVSHTGHTLNGWHTAMSGGSQVTTSTVMSTASAHTLYARWTANTYTVTLNNQSATSAGSTSVTATYGSPMPAITKPSRSYTVTYNANSGSVSPTAKTAAYTFVGYYTSTDNEGIQYYSTDGTSARIWDIASNTTLYAKWTSASVTLPTPSRTGYSFNGWYTATSGGTKIGATGATYTPTGNITIYAQWVDNIPPANPTVSGGSNTCIWSNGYKIYLSSSDSGSGLAKYQVDWDGDGVSNMDITSSPYIPWDGYTSCDNRYRAVDVAGNVSGWVSAGHIHMDTSGPSKPTINLNGYTSGTTTTSSVTITPSSTDNASGLAKYQYSHDNSSWADWPGGTGSWTITWNGDWNFYVRGVDKVGNAGPSSDVFRLIVSKPYKVSSGDYASTLQEAISLASADDTITLLKNFTDTSTVAFNKDLKFNFGTYHLTRSATIKINSGVSVTFSGTGGVVSTSNVTLTNNGTFTLNGATILNAAGSSESDTYRAIVMSASSGKVYLNTGKVYSRYGIGVVIQDDGSDRKALYVGSSSGSYSTTAIIVYGSTYAIYCDGSPIKQTVIWRNGSMYSKSSKWVTGNINEDPDRGSCGFNAYSTAPSKSFDPPDVTIGSHSATPSTTYMIWLTKTNGGSAACAS